MGGVIIGKIRARKYGNLDVAGSVKEFKVVDKLPETAEKVRLDFKQDVGDDELQHVYYNFYYDADQGYICIKVRETEKEIMYSVEDIINKLKQSGGNPLQLASGINDVYETYKDRMEQNGYDNYCIQLIWEDIKKDCNLY